MIWWLPLPLRHFAGDLSDNIVQLDVSSFITVPNLVTDEWLEGYLSK